MTQKQTNGGLENHQDPSDKNRRAGLPDCPSTSDFKAPAVEAQKAKSGKARSKKQSKAPTLPSAIGRRDPGTDVQRSSHLGTILLVDDNPEDVFMVGRAFQQVGVTNPLVVVRDGEQAIQYLRGEGEYADRAQFPIPQLILLDLSMPRTSGFEVLTWLRKQPQLRHLPVIILTTSTYSLDVKRAYQLGANSFLTKPTDFIELVSEVKAMSDFWLSVSGSNATSSPNIKASGPA